MSLNFPFPSFNNCMQCSSDLVIPHQMFRGLDHVVWDVMVDLIVSCSCHSIDLINIVCRLITIITLLFHRLGCCHMKCYVPYIFGCYLMENSVSMDLVVCLGKTLLL